MDDKKQAATNELTLSPEPPRLVVGIGASAGGLEALQSFFNRCPSDLGVAYVVVQHLSPDFKSMMDQLLSRCTEMPVTVAEEGELVKRDRVYLIPPKKSMAISGGRLLLSNTGPHSALSLPIDTFFRSLAEDRQHNCVGVVLSGTGSDGSRGIAVIKEVGGLVVVQDPSEAKFDGMPNASLQSGYVDHAMLAEQIPIRIAGYLKTYSVLTSGGEVPADAQNVLGKICELVQDHVNMNLGDYKTTTIGRRVDKRASLLNLESWQGYYEHLLEDETEREELGKEILIGVTRFFRDPLAFEYLCEKVIPEILTEAPAGENIRIWCTSCSSGEEAYSLAIAFVEVMEKLGVQRNVKIFGTDIDIRAINDASMGIYTSNIVNDLSTERLQKFFVARDDGKYQISPIIRRMAVFATQNLVSDPPFSNMNLVTCRNMMIYLHPSSQKKVQHYLQFSLKLNGVLFIGPSENLFSELEASFEVLDSKNKFFKKKKSIRLPMDRHMPTPDEKIQQSLQLNSSIVTGSDKVFSTNYKSQNDSLTPVFKKLVEEFAPATIIFNMHHEVMYSIGDCTPYTRKIQPGRSSLKVDSILEEVILVPVTTAMQKAKRDKVPITYTGVSMPGHSALHQVDITVTYIDFGVSHHDCLALSFLDPDKASGRKQDVIPFDEKQMMENRINDLEFELQETKANLVAAVEELEASNEELQSTNEELMAANEELQSTNEELQSVNEELYSVNAEYQHKMHLLEQSTSDLENLLKNTQIPMLVLDRDLGIRRYSAELTEYFSIIDADLERSIKQISNSLEGDIVADCQHVINSATALQTEYTTSDKRLLVAYISPYVDIHNTLDGVVVSLIDITQTTILQKEKSEMQSMHSMLQENYQHLVDVLNPLSVHANPERLRVLVVDDSIDDQKLFEEQLKNIGLFEVDIECRESVENALYAVNEKEFDIVFLDYYLADKTAEELLEHLAKLPDYPPILLFTAKMNTKAKQDLVKYGVYDFIPKESMDAELLERSIRLALHNKHIDRFLKKVKVVSLD